MFIDILFDSGIDSSLLEELPDIEQVRGDMDCVGDNAFEIIREVPERGLIFQCEVEITVEEVKELNLLRANQHKELNLLRANQHKDTKSWPRASPVELNRLRANQHKDTKSWPRASPVDERSQHKARSDDGEFRHKASDVLSKSDDLHNCAVSYINPGYRSLLNV